MYHKIYVELKHDRIQYYFYGMAMTWRIFKRDKLFSFLVTFLHHQFIPVSKTFKLNVVFLLELIYSINPCHTYWIRKREKRNLEQKMIFLKFHLKTLGTILICILHMIIPYNADRMRNKVFPSCKFSFDLSVARMQKASLRREKRT